MKPGAATLPHLEISFLENGSWVTTEYTIARDNETGDLSYWKETRIKGVSSLSPISEEEYFAAAAKRDELKKKPKTGTVKSSVDTPRLGGEGGEGGGGSH
jgi:hypothetical protein